MKQECIPVGCLLPAAVAVSGGGSVWVHAWTPPGVGLETPLGVGLETPQARPLKCPPGCGPGDLQGMAGYHPPGDLQGMLGYYPPPLTEFLKHSSENITFPQLRCGR